MNDFANGGVIKPTGKYLIGEVGCEYLIKPRVRRSIRWWLTRLLFGRKRVMIHIHSGVFADSETLDALADLILKRANRE